MSTQLSFSVSEDHDAETNKTVQYGTFSRNWAEEVELDALIDSLEAGRISHEQGLLRARKLLVKFPGQLEIQNFIANRLWSLEMRDESTDLREKAYRQAIALLPPAFKGQISWAEIDNRSFLRIAHGFLLGLMHRGDSKAAKVLATKLLAWCPADNLGVRMLIGDISLMTGDSKTAMKSYLKEAATSPAHWYQAGQIAFRDGDFVSACTYMRRGIAANPYIAEGLTGRTLIKEHLYWHASNRYGPDWATDYLSAPVCDWSAQEIDFPTASSMLTVLTPNSKCSSISGSCRSMEVLTASLSSNLARYPWAIFGLHSKTPTLGWRLLTGLAPYLLVARGGFEPPTFGL